MTAQGGAPVLLDATALGAAFLARRFPGLDAVVREAGFDWSREAVPITPAAHYAMGGVVTDLDGRTSLPGLYAVGETARTGVHGANRLASNSLLEAAVFAERAARALASTLARSRPPPKPRYPSPPKPRLSDQGKSGRHAVGLPAVEGVSPTSPDRADASRRTVDREQLRELMWQRVGLERDAAGLAAASARLDAWSAPEVSDRRTAEDRNLLDLARLTVSAALARRESVGAHFRTDDPTPAASSAEPAAPELEAA